MNRVREETSEVWALRGDTVLRHTATRQTTVFRHTKVPSFDTRIHRSSTHDTTVLRHTAGRQLTVLRHTKVATNGLNSQGFLADNDLKLRSINYKLANQGVVVFLRGGE